MLAIVIGIMIISIIVFFIIFITIVDTYSSYYCKFPEKIKIPEIKGQCIRTRMKFNRWRKLFELDPWNFIFLKDDGFKVNINQMTYDFRWTHPSYYDKNDERLYIIVFNFKEYFHYFWYRRRIIELYSDIFGDRITQEIVGTVQAKIDALVNESQKQIEDSLNLQKKIILQLSSDSKRGENN